MDVEWKRVVLAAVSVFALLAGGAGATAKYNGGDRVEVLLRFVSSLYPQAGLDRGMVTFQVFVPDVAPNYLRFSPCHPGSGVPAALDQSRVQQCTPMHDVGEDSLTISVGFARNAQFITSFGSSGALFEKLNLIRQQTTTNRYWTEQQMTERARERLGHRSGSPVRVFESHPGCIP